MPATYLKIIRDVTRQEEESDTARKEGYGKKTDGTKIGGEIRQDGEEREGPYWYTSGRITLIRKGRQL